MTTALGHSNDLKNKIFVDCSTIHPHTVGLTATKLQERDASFLAAPVFGGHQIAVDGKLVFALGGPRRAGEAVRPLIQDVMGRRVIECGEDATRASLLKIAGFVLPLLLVNRGTGGGLMNAQEYRHRQHDGSRRRVAGFRGEIGPRDRADGGAYLGGVWGCCWGVFKTVWPVSIVDCAW
jgi:hypothetical protein